MAGYRSNDKDYLKEFKKYLKSNVDLEIAKNTWSFYNKYLFIEDLHKYLRNLTKSNIDVGFGDYNSNIVIVLPTLTEPTEIKFLKELFGKINIDMNKIYITPLCKCEGPYVTECTETLHSEILKINPQVVFTIGDIFTSFGNAKVIDVDGENFNMMLELYNRDNLSDVEKADLVKRKQIFWNKLKFIIKYYSA